MNYSDAPPLRPEITDVQLRFVEDGRNGLLAWASCVLGGTVILNNIAVRRGRDGGMMLTYPAKLTNAGTRFYYFNPISREASAALERAILRRLAEVTEPTRSLYRDREAG